MVRQHAWFLAFLALIALLAALEFRFPQFPRDAERARRWPTNFGLAIVNALMASSTPVLTIWSAHWAAGQGVGLFNWMAAPWWLAWPGTLLARSLAQYAIHVAAHKIPILWRLHRVHHCDVHLDVSSALRAHPLDMIASIAFMIPLVVLSGMSPVVLVVYESVEIVVIVLTHANMRVPRAADRCARALFVTPSLHRLHHSPDRVETDSNFGNVFTFWDRLFGTYRGEPIRADDRFQFGLDDVSREHASDFGHQLRLPWI